MKKIIFASRNKGKIAEVKRILSGLNFELIPLLDFTEDLEIEETGDSFEANAKIKAVKAFEKFNFPSIGDDSGLAVEQLNGAPGIYSARYSGKHATDEQNNKKLILELQKYSEPHKAKFVCTAIFFDGKNFIKTEGELKGKIIKNSRGKNGFGYDPYFVPDGSTKTTAEISIEEKNKISHRAKAFDKLRNTLKEIY